MNRKSFRTYITTIKKNKCNSSLKRYIFSKLFYMENISFERLVKELKEDKSLSKKFMSFLQPCRKRELLDYQIVLNENVKEMCLIRLASFFISSKVEVISEFIRMKKMYENHIYREEYEAAVKTLDLIDEKICVSLWSCSQRFVLEEQLNGLEGNKQLLDEYLNIANNKPVISAVLDFMSNLAEKNTSYYNFQDKIKKLLKVLDTQKLLCKFFNYKFNLDYEFNYCDIASVLQIELQFSIIDLYESYVYIFLYDSVNKRIYYDLIQNTASKIWDNRLLNTMVLVDYQTGMIQMDRNSNYYDIFEYYTKGNYEETINRIIDYHNFNDIDFQLVIMYIKAHIYLNRVIKSSSILINAIYNIYSLNEQYNESVSILNSFLKQYAFVDWGKKIRTFINRKTRYDVNNKSLLVSFLYDNILSPNFSKCLLNSDSQHRFIQDMEKMCQVTSNLFECYIYGKEIVDKNIDDRRRTIYNIIINNIESTDILEKLIKNTLEENAYYSEKLIRLLFVNYLSHNNVSKYVSLCVKGYIKNHNYIKRLPIEESIRVLESSPTTEFYTLMEYPIFIFISNPHSANEVRYAYENFLEANEIENVLDLLKTKTFNKQYLFFSYQIYVQLKC